VAALGTLSLRGAYKCTRRTAASIEADLRGALKNTDKRAPDAAKPNMPPGTTPTDPSKGENTSVDPELLGTQQDYQLARALDLLRGIAVFNGRGVN
jgi:carboxyl-terminal processing protease